MIFTVGTDHDTAAFAVGAIRRWWDGGGRAAYPAARRLLITADAGGSNGYRTRAWKAELAALALDTGVGGPTTGPPPTLTLGDRLLATILHHRMRLPQVAIAALLDVRPETINRRIRDIRQILTSTGHVITPDQRLASLEDLHAFLDAAEISHPGEIKTASR